MEKLGFKETLIGLLKIAAAEEEIGQEPAGPAPEPGPSPFTEGEDYRKEYGSPADIERLFGPEIRAALEGEPPTSLKDMNLDYALSKQPWAAKDFTNLPKSRQNTMDYLSRVSEPMFSSPEEREGFWNEHSGDIPYDSGLMRSLGIR